MTYYQFAKWEPRPLEEVLSARLPTALAEYDKGNKKPLQDMYIVTDKPYSDIGGWRFSLHGYLKKYWVMLKGYGIQQYYAINKTTIRKVWGNSVVKIVGVD